MDTAELIVSNSEISENGIEALPREDWVAEKIGTDHPPILSHVVRQTERLGLEPDSSGLDILEAGLLSEANNVAISGSFAWIVDAHMPIEVSTKPSAQGGGSREDTYDRWRAEKEKTALDLIREGISRLRRLKLSDFWDGVLWKLLTFNGAYTTINYMGADLLAIVLSEDNTPEDWEGLVASCLAKEFSQDVVKAEIIESDEPIPVGERGVMDGRADEIQRLRHITTAFAQAAESGGFKLYEDFLPISRGWVSHMIRAVAAGNDALLEDLTELFPALAKAQVALAADMAIMGTCNFGYEERVAYEHMAGVLAKYFPQIILSGLTPPTETVLRDYQAGWDPDTEEPKKKKKKRRKKAFLNRFSSFY